jgi:hypothetical protein
MRQKLRVCEDTKPLAERLNGWVADKLSSMKDSLLFDSMRLLLAPSLQIRCARQMFKNVHQSAQALSLFGTVAAELKANPPA